MDTLSLTFPGADFFVAPGARERLEAEIFPAYIPRCRWFGGKARQVRRYAVKEIIPVGEKPEDARLCLVLVEYAEGAAETYLLPLQAGAGVAEEAPPIARFSDGAVLQDALHGEAFRSALLRLLSRGGEAPGAHGAARGEPGSAMPPEAAHGLPSRVLGVEQSNSSLIYGDGIFVKLFRKLEDGLHPDVEINRFLSEKRHFAHVPPFAGTLAYHGAGGEPQVLVLALGMVPNEGDAWVQTLAAVGQFLALARDVQDLSSSGGVLAGGDDSDALRDMAGPFVARVRQLGVRTAETHLALAADDSDPAFAPEPFTGEDQRELGAAVRASAERMFQLLRQRAADEPLAKEAMAAETKILSLAARIGSQEVPTAKIRTHGDYHLGQVLNTGDDYILIDFEGEPQRTLAERQRKRSPLRDVAGMLRSFHYAAHSGLGEFPEHREQLTPWAELWSGLMCRTFLRAWLEECAGAPFLPVKLEEVSLLLDAFLLEKAIYEVGYELNNRPTWVGIPLRGILQIVRQN